MLQEFAASHRIPVWGDPNSPGGVQFRTRKLIFGLTAAGFGADGSLIDMFYLGNYGDMTRTELNTFLMARVNPLYKITSCADLGVRPSEMYDAPFGV